MKITLVYKGNKHVDKYFNIGNPRSSFDPIKIDGELPVLAWVPDDLPGRFRRSLNVAGIPMAAPPL